jgi:hypothetical protein
MTMTLDIDFVRAQFPALREGTTAALGFFENAADRIPAGRSWTA